MQLDRLQLDLRPRPNIQALDLGFALLRQNPLPVFLAWMALWVPLVFLCGVGAWMFPSHDGAWLLAAWWFKPLLERAPLYVLSRQVFGEEVRWQDAVRAWPRQLGGGWLRMLTWWRPFVPSRGLFQPTWQLEGARGEAAAKRRKLIGEQGTARSAYWFGVACAHFEFVLQLGLIGLIGVFVSDESLMNPLAFIMKTYSSPGSPLTVAVNFSCYAVAGSIIGPVYIACCFTLYLNRRANLEAWDIEIMLRQIQPPALRKGSGQARAAAWLPVVGWLAALLAASLLQPAPALAQQRSTAANLDKCEAPAWAAPAIKARAPDASLEQAALRQEIRQLYRADDLTPYTCQSLWAKKNKQPDEKLEHGASRSAWRYLGVLADIVKILLIAAAIGLLGWLLYRYRDRLPGLRRRLPPGSATEIAGLDIRPESLPDDVASSVRTLWAAGQRRAALALLYRATLSRLATDHGLRLNTGATESDCLRLADLACREQRLSPARMDVAATATGLWLNGAYGDRWPDQGTLESGCDAWQAQFGKAGT